jgi:hypothetical protein
MTIDHSDAVGWPAEATHVERTRWRPGFGEPDPRLRKRELFPSRYDNRPLHVRALEARDEVAA